MTAVLGLAVLALFAVVFLPASGKAAPDVLPTPTPYLEPELTPAEYRQRFLTAANRVDRRGFDPKLLLAVSSLETGNGSGGVFRRTRNLFSITRGSFQAWPGPVYTTKAGLSFRIYTSWELSIMDFIRLMGKARYARAYNNRDNPEQFFKELKAAGYDATSPTYARDAFARYNTLKDGLA